MAVTARDLAAAMLSEIKKDQSAGIVPKNVRRFSELHDHVDANDYGMEFLERRMIEVSPGTIRLINQAQDLVDRELASVKPKRTTTTLRRRRM